MLRKASNASEDIVSIYKLIKYGAENAQVLYRPKMEIEKSIDSFWVWEVGGGKIVACCALDIYSKKLAEIRSLVVASDFQRKGIGTKLIRKCVKKAKRQGIYEVLAVTDRETAYFLKMVLKSA